MVAITQNNKFDVLQGFVQQILHFFKRRENFFSSPSDGLFLKLHYKYSFWLLMIGFTAIYFNWLTNDIIKCFSHYNVEAQAKGDLLNICLSYPFDTVGGSRITLLYYRWIHWVLLLCALAYVIPHKLAKIQKYDKITRMMDFLSQCIFNYGLMWRFMHW